MHVHYGNPTDYDVPHYVRVVEANGSLSNEAWSCKYSTEKYRMAGVNKYFLIFASKNSNIT